MSSRKPRLTGKQLCKLLEKRGHALKRISGSHTTVPKDGMGGFVTVPVHGNEILSPMLVQSILKQARLTWSDLE